MTSNHAIVFGASGLAGWAIVDELLSNYPTSATFTKVTAVVNRPMKIEDSHWPVLLPDRPQLQLVDGVNLTSGSITEFSAFLKGKVKDIETVTHVFYFAFKQDDDQKAEYRTNISMFERVVGIMDILAPELKFFTYPGGTRGYGIWVPGGIFTPPLAESMLPIPEPHRSDVFYYAYEDILRKACAGKSWTWSEICPDTIVGFAPNGSNYNLTAHWMTYLSAYALIEGHGALVPFPGTSVCYNAISTDASSAIIARAAIWASLHPEKSGGQIFNIADTEKPMSMKERWSKIAEYFGLEGTGPAEEGVLKPGEYVEKHAILLEKKGIRPQVWQGHFLDTVGQYLTFDRQFCLQKIRAAGFAEERDVVQSWYAAFDRFKAASMTIM